MSLTSTEGLYEGSPIVIDLGGGDEEWHVVKTVTDGESVTLWGNLANTQSVAATAKSYGLFYGMVNYPWEGYELVRFFAWGKLQLELDSYNRTTTFTGVGDSATLIKHKSTDITCVGATETWANAIPAGTIVLGVTAKVTTLITGATSFDVGISGGDVDLFIDGMSVALNTTGDIANSNASFTNPISYQSNTSILVTAIGGNFTAGVLRLVLHYIDLTAPVT